MSQTFNGITVSYTNGLNVDAGWWQQLKDAGVTLENAAGLTTGAGGIAETAFTFANNQVAAANVTLCVFDSTVSKDAYIEVAVRRITTTTAVRCMVFLHVFYDTLLAQWVFGNKEEVGRDASGLTFSITTAGQLQYTSDTTSGSTYNGASKFRARTMA